MAFKIPFIEVNQRLTAVESYTILETKKLKKLLGGILHQY